MRITKKITALTVIVLMISSIPQSTLGTLYAGGPAISPLDPAMDPNAPTTSLQNQGPSSTSPYGDDSDTTTGFLSASALSMASSASFSASAPRTIELRPSDYNYNDPEKPAAIDQVTMTITQGQATIGVDVSGTFAGSTPPNSPYVIAQLYTSGQSLNQAAFDWMQNPGHIDLSMSNVKANINYRMTVSVFWPGTGAQSNTFEYFFRYDATILNASVDNSQQGQLQVSGFDIDGATTQQNQIYIDLVDANQNMVRVGGWLNFGTDAHVTTALNFTDLPAGQYRLRGLLNGGISEYIYSDVTYTVTGPSVPRVLATGNVVINNGATSTNNTAINLKINATDLIGEGIDEMCISINSLTCNSWAAFNANTVASLPTYQGTNYINVFLRNYKNGKKDEAWFWSSINYVTTPPTATVTINGGQTLTNSQTVTLAITPANPSTIRYMSFSVNDLNDAAFSAKEAFSASKTLTLPGGDGAKYVNVMLEDEFGQKYKYNYSMITLDQTAPVSSFIINNGATSTTDRNITVNMTPGDAVKMRFAINGFSDYSAWEDVSATKALTLPDYTGTNYVNAEFMDAAGNITLAWKSIALNSTPVVQTTRSAQATQTSLTAQSVSYQITGSGFTPNAIVYVQMFKTDGTYAASNSLFADANGNINQPIQYSTTPGTSYNFYVVDAATNVKLDTKTFTAPTIDPYGIYYAGAGNITTSGITQTQARFHWWLSNYNPSAHEVLIGYRVAGTSGAYIFVPVVTTEPYPTAGTITGLTANTSYDIVVRIRAKADPTVYQDTTALNLFKTLS